MKGRRGRQKRMRAVAMEGWKSVDMSIDETIVMMYTNNDLNLVEHHYSK
jgi:hypothetical protein